MVGLVLPTNLKFAPYVQSYIDILDAKKIPYEIIIWDKKKMEKPTPSIYQSKINTTDRISWRKIACYIGYILFLRKRIRKQNYEKLIVFTVVPAIMISDLLLNQYDGKYVLDIRDDSILRRWFSKRIQKIASKAKNLVVSSPYYFKWLGRDGILNHNANEKIIERELSYEPIASKKETVCIMYAGMMREADINNQVLERLVDDTKYSFVFYGPINDQLISLKKKYEGKTNVSFPGIYNKEDIYSIYRTRADLINILRSKNTVNAEALPNKLYEAAIAGVPVIAFAHNTAVAEYVKKYNLGIIINNLQELNAEDDLIVALHNLDSFEYKKGRQDFLNKVRQDNLLFIRSISAFVSEEI